MGIQFTDKYSLLHYLVGCLFAFLRVSFPASLFAHITFEITENTHVGMEFINKHMKWWPGGKPSADSVRNSVGDTFWFCVGWYVIHEMMGKRCR